MKGYSQKQNTMLEADGMERRKGHVVFVHSSPGTLAQAIMLSCRLYVSSRKIRLR